MARAVGQRVASARGRLAEDCALRHLRKSGLALVARNYHCRFGEIDLVMRDAECLVFVEVRFRSPNRFATARDSVDTRKQARITTAATAFLAGHPEFADTPARFDVVALDGADRDNWRIEWIRDAFRL